MSWANHPGVRPGTVSMALLRVTGSNPVLEMLEGRGQLPKPEQG